MVCDCSVIVCTVWGNINLPVIRASVTNVSDFVVSERAFLFHMASMIALLSREQQSVLIFSINMCGGV